MIWYDLSEKYTGKWKDNLQNGFGMHIWYEPKGEQKALRNRYVGEWVKGIRAGYGVFFYSNGAKYEGSWKDNYKDGFGVYTFQDGSQYIGKFKKDRLLDNDNQVSPDKLIEMIENKRKEANLAAIAAAQQAAKKASEASITGSPKRRSIIGANKALATIQEKSNVSNVNLSPTKPPLPSTVTPPSKEEEVKAVPINHNSNPIDNNLNQQMKPKSLNKYHTLFDITDLILLDESIEKESIELENLLLRSLSEIKTCYLAILKGDKETEDLNTSKILSKEKDKEKEKIQSNTPPKIIECINNNDITFSLEIKEIWRYLRDIGLVGQDFTIAEFNRSYCCSPKNDFNMFYIPEELSDQSIYNYLYTNINKSKSDFVYKYYNYIDYYYDNERSDKETAPFYLSNSFLKQNDTIKESFNQLDQSIHSKSRIVLLRQFYEMLIRIAFIKYPQSSNKTITQKLHAIITIITASQKSKRTGNKSNRSNFSKTDLSVIGGIQTPEIKAKTIEKNAIDDFISTNEFELKKIFQMIYDEEMKYTSNNYIDMTITYNFFYNNIIKKSKTLNDLIGNKLRFIEIINYYHKDKQIYSNDDLVIKANEVYNYVRCLLAMECIYFEFCELVYFIGKKYISRNKLQENNKNYMDVLGYIEMTIAKRGRGVCKRYHYIYPLLPQHVEKQKLIDMEMARIELERLYQKEVSRYMMERIKMDQEKDNAYVEDNEDDEEMEESFESEG